MADGQAPTLNDFATTVLGELSKFAARAVTDANHALSAIEATVAPYTRWLRPWSEFVSLQLPDPDLEYSFLKRIVGNIAYFQANYLLISSMLFAIAVYRHTSWILAVLLLMSVWVAYITRGGLDPSWKPVVAGVELPASHRLGLLYAGSLLLILVVFGEALLVLIGILGTLTGTHALCHPGPAQDMADSQLRPEASV
eukprot:gb/GFBE01022376.1/.p1 GENE.gb/GFBE01022376.1/~~gb/GFBE01022376.1/.p1  ORF type:complete len:197 (+),score=32.29 gb/GFBE01022376.1/:1-591(+)